MDTRLTEDQLTQLELNAAIRSCRLALTRWIYCFGRDYDPYEERERNSRRAWEDLAKRRNSHHN